MNKNKTVAVIIVVAMLSMAAVPCIGSSEDSNDSDAGVFDGIMNIIDFVGGFSAGFGLGLSLWIDSGIPAGGDQEAVNSALRQAEANGTTNTLSTAANMIIPILSADADMIPFTANYWMRSAEYASAEYWTLDSDIDTNLILYKTGINNNFSNYLYSWQSAMENAFNGAGERQKNWTGAYDSMSLSLQWQGGSLTTTGTSSDANKIWIDVAQFATPTTGHNVVYIDTEAQENASGEDWSRYFVLYSFGGSGTIKNISTGHVYNVSSGANDLTNILDASTGNSGRLPSGYYELSAGHTYAGPILPCGDDSADVRGGMVIGSGTTMYYILPNSSGDGIKIYNQGNIPTTSSTLDWVITYTGPNGSTTSVSNMVVDEDFDVIASYDTLVSSIGTVVDMTVTASQAVWDIFDACEESSIYLSPSMITTNISGYTMSTAEIEAVYIQQLMQIVTFYNENKTLLTGMTTVTTVESLDLYVYADLYLNGELLAEGLVLTPYITNSSISLKDGMNSWNGSGFAMVWYQTDDFDDWDGSTSTAKFQIVDLSAANALDIKKIVKDGEEVDSVDLTLHEVKKYGSNVVDPEDPPESPRVVSIVPFIMIIFLEAATIVGLIWWMAGKPWILLLIVLILVVIGIALPGVIAGLI